MITSFKYEFEFLSNFYPVRVMYAKIVYPSVEHAYQAAKFTDQLERKLIRSCATPGRAKVTARKCKSLKHNWEQTKLQVMEKLVRRKFQHKHLLRMLLETGTHELVEGNWWNDTFWGVCGGVGENHLGKILMNIRTEAQAKLKQPDPMEITC